jgi:uncharacterized membrane protein
MILATRGKTSMVKGLIRNKHFCPPIFGYVLVLLVLAVQPLSVCTAQQYTTEMSCPDYWQITYPNKVVTFELTVANPSSSYDNFMLGISIPSLPEGWRADFYAQNKWVRGIGVEGGGSMTITLNIAVPADAVPSDYQFAACAQGQYSEALRLLTVTVEGLPSVKYEVDVYCSFDWLVAYPGNNLTFHLSVTNRAPYRDNYLLYIDNPRLPTNWTAIFQVGENEVRSLTVATGESVNLNLTVNVSKDAAYGDYEFRVNFDGDYAIASQGLTVTVERVARKISLECPVKVQSILTGQSTYFPIKVMNEGPQTENVFISLNRTSDIIVWDITLSESQLTLGPQESAWMVLNVKPPDIAAQGNYTIGLEAYTEDGKIEVPLQVVTNIIASYLLEITGMAPVHPQVYQGEKIDVTITVSNVGQSPVTGLKLIVNSTGLSNILVTPLDYSVLEAKSNVDFDLRISAGSNLAVGDYILQLQAQSSETSSSIRELAVTVSSQIPWSTIIIAVAIVATAIVVLVIQSLIKKAGIHVKVRK